MLEVICGPMFSGKSEELLRRAELCKIAGLSVAAFKPITDTRTRTIKSRSGFELPAWEVEFIHLAHDADVWIIDEAQFFHRSNVYYLKYVAMHSRVIVSGLDLDFQRHPFGIMPDLLALAQKVTKLTAVCHRCKSFDACYTQRIVEGKPVDSGEQVLIGDTESYEARCIECWME